MQFLLLSFAIISCAVASANLRAVVEPYLISVESFNSMLNNISIGVGWDLRLRLNETHQPISKPFISWDEDFEELLHSLSTIESKMVSEESRFAREEIVEDLAVSLARIMPMIGGVHVEFHLSSQNSSPIDMRATEVFVGQLNALIIEWFSRTLSAGAVDLPHLSRSLYRQFGISLRFEIDQDENGSAEPQTVGQEEVMRFLRLGLSSIHANPAARQLETLEDTEPFIDLLGRLCRSFGYRVTRTNEEVDMSMSDSQEIADLGNRMNEVIRNVLFAEED